MGDSHSKTVITALGSRKVVALLTLYVDHVLLVGGDRAVLEMFRDKLARFKTTDVGDVSSVLGTTHPGSEEYTLAISLNNYTRFVLKSMEWWTAIP